MRAYAWVAVIGVQVLAACEQTSVAAGADGGADTAADAVVDAADVVAADSESDAPADALDCAATMTALQAAIAGILDSHNDCQQDADCTQVSVSTACQGACGSAVNIQYVSAFQTLLAALDHQYCTQTGYAAACGYASPKCIAPNPGCINSKCVYKK